MRPEVRERRRAVGWTQAELAAAAGVSRSLVAAVEAGRHVPSVATALALAHALGRDVESLFAPLQGKSPACEPVLGPAPAGSPVRLARVAGRSVYVPLEGVARLRVPADAVLTGSGPELLAGGETAGIVVAGCEPALDLLERLLPGRGPRRLLSLRATSARARRALLAGRCHGAVVHGRPRDLERSCRPDETRLQLAAWHVGLAWSGAAPPRLEHLAGLRVVRRPPDAAAQRTLERALRAAGLPATSGPVAAGHLEAAALVLGGAADAALTIEPVARSAGLHFLPLERHRVELRAVAPGGGIEALADVITSGGFRQRLAGLAGYEV